MVNLTVERAKQYFDYNEENGNLVVKERTKNEFDNANYVRHLKRVGSVAGSLKNSGYIEVKIDGKLHKAHRVIWLIMHGEMPPYPEFEIDHINGIRSDNRLSNLRSVSSIFNRRNRGANQSNGVGMKGITWSKKYLKWHTRIGNGGSAKHLGYFEKLEDAILARSQAEKELGYIQGNRPSFAGQIINELHNAT